MASKDSVKPMPSFSLIRTFAVLWEQHNISQGIPFPISLHRPNEESEQLVHPCNLIRVFAEHSVGSQVFKASETDSEGPLLLAYTPKRPSFIA